MTKQLPPEHMTKHLQCNPPKTDNNADSRFSFDNVDVIFRGIEIYGNTLDEALNNAITQAGDNGYVINAPTLIAAKLITHPDSCLWERSFNVRSAEFYGIDVKGLYGNAGEPVLVIVHGEGLNPERLKGFCSAKPFTYINQNEFNVLLEKHTLPNGKLIDVLTLNELMADPTQPRIYDCYGVVINNGQIKNSPSKVSQSVEDVVTPLNIARSGGLHNCRDYFTKIAETTSVFIENPYENMSLPIIPEVRQLEIAKDGLVKIVSSAGYGYIVLEGKHD